MTESKAQPTFVSDRSLLLHKCSRRGQTLYASVMIVIPLIPIMALVIQNIIILRDVIERKENLLVADRSVLKSDETARLIAALQRERTASLMQVSGATK